LRYPGYVSLVNVRGAVVDSEVGDPSVSWWGAAEDSMLSSVAVSLSPAVAAMWSSSVALLALDGKLRRELWPLLSTRAVVRTP